MGARKSVFENRSFFFFILNNLIQELGAIGVVGPPWILAAKLFIYKCKLSNTYPSIQVFKAKIKALYHVEKPRANRRNKLTTHFKKWKKFLPFVTARS